MVIADFLWFLLWFVAMNYVPDIKKWTDSHGGWSVAILAAGFVVIAAISG